MNPNPYEIFYDKIESVTAEKRMKEMRAFEYWMESELESAREAQRNAIKRAIREEYRIRNRRLKIKNVIFNDPATIVFWNDNTKTVVKAVNEPYDPEKGLSMAISKKFFGNSGSYYKEFKKWISKSEESINFIPSELKETIKDIRGLLKTRDCVKYTVNWNPITNVFTIEIASSIFE